MRRRDFIAALGGAAVMPFAARAQQSPIPVIGFLNGGTPGAWAAFVAAFRRGLSETGYVEGQNVAIEFRWAEHQIDRVPGLVADLARRQVAVIFAGGNDAAVLAVKAAISAIPIVFAIGGDPVEYGLVSSLNQPGGNVTGVMIVSSELWPKRLDLLRELVPSASVIGVLVNPNHPSAAASTNGARTAARTIGRRVVVVNASSEHDFDTAFATLSQQGVGALLVANDTLFLGWRERLAALAALHAVPAIYDRRDYAEAGGLISYGATAVDQYRHCGLYVGRILKGAKPADLPVWQPTKFELVINLKTARALGIAVPNSMQLLADEVIE
jgi:putative ABC transport system substrate-binding protein